MFAQRSDSLQLAIRTGRGSKTVKFAAGLSLREILDTTNLRVRSACRGNGSCGLCRVRLISGPVSEPSRNERIHLTATQLEHGVRLACQTVPRGDIELAILNPAPPSQWKRSAAGELKRRGHLLTDLTAADRPRGVKLPLGVAVDLGTSHLSVSLCHLLEGQRLADRYGLNPQTVYGLDIMSRLTVASQSPETAQDMSRLMVGAIGDALLDISQREGIDLKQIVYLALVGNTAMLALLAGKNYELLLKPALWMEYIDCQPEDTAVWRQNWGLHPQARVETIAPLAGFVGSDLLAGIVATQRREAATPYLFIDFGANSELALWDGSSLLATSAAGGPAFESWGIACGMPAGSGAIFRVGLDGQRLRYKTIDDAPARGLCGTGLIDLIACLVKLGQINPRGKFAEGLPREGFTIAEGVTLTPGDVDALQRAKAAVATATQALLSEVGLSFAGLARVSVAGAFGQLLDVGSAQEIGLLPPIDPLRLELMGNTALLGCEDIMLSAEAAARLAQLRQNSRIINLARFPGFADSFLQNLYLRPMEPDDTNLRSKALF